MRIHEPIAMDILGRQLNVNDLVLAVHNNRPFLFKVTEVRTSSVTMTPAVDARKRGWSIPPKKKYVREGYNVYLVNQEDFFMYELTGRR